MYHKTNTLAYLQYITCMTRYKHKIHKTLPDLQLLKV